MKTARLQNFLAAALVGVMPFIPGGAQKPAPSTKAQTFATAGVANAMHTSADIVTVNDAAPRLT